MNDRINVVKRKLGAELTKAEKADKLSVAPMPSESFKEFVMDQLRLLPEVSAKAMFGGHGLYQGNHFFGILMEGRLYFKTNEASRKAYVRRGMGPFVYEKARQTMTINYYEVPADVLENSEELLTWARDAVKVASTRPRKPAKRGASRRPV